MHSPHPIPVRYDRLLSDEELARGYHREFVGGHWETLGRLQLDFLRGRGLRPEHRLLDIGCGCLRGGLPLIRYLQPGKYTGVDKNASLVQAAWLELRKAGQIGRRPTLLVEGDFHFERLGQKFDFALAHSLFTHLPPMLIERCLARVAEALVPGGSFYATYFPVPAGHTGGPLQRVDGIITHDDEDPFHQPVTFYEQVCQPGPLVFTNLGDWGHPRGQHMLEFRRPC